MASYTQLSPVPIVNPYVIIEKTRKLGIVEKGLVRQSPRKQRAALPFQTLKCSFLQNTKIPPWKIVLFVNHYLISSTTGLHWNVQTFLQEHR